MLGTKSIYYNGLQLSNSFRRRLVYCDVILRYNITLMQFQYKNSLFRKVMRLRRYDIFSNFKLW